MPEIVQTVLPNGLTVVAEPIPGASSLAMTLLTPAGLASQPVDQQGVAPLLSEMICRGAGGKTARQHSDALDTLGVQRSTDAQTRFFRIGATMIGSKMKEALPLLFDMARTPTLAEEALAPSVDLSIQAIDSLADEPQRRAMLELRSQHYPDPVGRPPVGVREHLENMTVDTVRKFWFEHFVARGSILGFAGSFDTDELLATVNDLLGDWGGEAHPAHGQGAGTGGVHHVHTDSTQVHIALAYPTIPDTHEDRVLQQAATAVLSGGMSGRLFTEVREKRGLVYSVYATYAGQKDRGDVLAYAGTTVPRAQETLDVLSGELRRLSEGVNQSEFERAIVGMKSSLVMQGESTTARGASIASDVYVFGQPRSLEYAASEVDAVTLDQLNAYLKANPPGDMTIVTLGPEPLKA
ncbi:M16 family metallopeptidase [Algisphaera agarilytica]|uniref:Putative Zn-dependent peptidase n=1 Tax=Algisphaera agarilytica TaxID=1385975 RepID=A0A7X0LLH5_9BACT|nr:pitrilysin family protein [Algisphaera agarilytica]MBB6429978.1 putative Zn-dependent peptidase [Algisphaera agarilytica]